MENFYQFWRDHYPLVNPGATTYVDRKYRAKAYEKKEVIKLPDDTFPYFCIVLEGLVGGYTLSRSGRESMRELALPMDFFTGTEHAFSKRARPIEYRALEKTRLLLLHLEDAQEGQKLFQEVAELFQILKQRKILHLRKLIEVYQEETAFDRYAAYAELLPGLVLATSHTVQAALLHMSLTNYNRVKQLYWKEK